MKKMGYWRWNVDVAVLVDLAAIALPWLPLVLLAA